MAKLNLRNAFEDIKVDNLDQMLVKGSMMPFNASNSGSRKLMFGTHLEQRLALCNPDVPFIETGHEMEFGLHSSSIILADTDYRIFDKIYKFQDSPNTHFYLIAVDEKNKLITVFEKKEYKHITESYGYMYSNQAAINFAEPGNIIPKGSAILKSNAFDDYNNRMDGKNLLTMYTACEETIEDAIVISESAAKQLASPLIKKVVVQINDNDIPLNLYGSDDTYKIFPDVGEMVDNGILCGLRVEKKEESLYSLSYNRLRELMISDDRYTVSGKVVDIDVYCNAPDKFIDNPYYEQIHKYYLDQWAMNQHIVDAIEIGLKNYFEDGYKMDYELHKLYSKAKGALNGKQYYTNGKVFSNIVIEITVIDEIPVCQGDKITNRYGGKGVTSIIKPDDQMPKTEDGRNIDVLLNMCGVVGRENAGQLFELSISYICIKLVEYFRMQVLSADECIGLYLDLLRIISPTMYEYTSRCFDEMSDEDTLIYIQNIMDDESIYLAIEPMTENMTLNKLEQLYEEFPWIHPETILVPIEDSMGNTRYERSRRPIVYGYLYFYRLKQYAEEKFSVTSLSSTNIKNENTRNKASNNYKALYPRTPIRFGDMETGNLSHMGADLVAQILMLYSASPLARQLCSQLETGDPFNVDVRLDNDSKNRNVEILNVYLKTKGLRIVFSKKLKKKNSPMVVHPMEFFDVPDKIQDPMIIYPEGVKFDIDSHIEALIESKDKKTPMTFIPMEFWDDVSIEEDKEEAVER